MGSTVFPQLLRGVCRQNAARPGLAKGGSRGREGSREKGLHCSAMGCGAFFRQYLAQEIGGENKQGSSGLASPCTAPPGFPPCDTVEPLDATIASFKFSPQIDHHQVEIATDIYIG